MNGSPILRGQQFVQVSGNIVSDMNGEKVMMSIQKSKYFNLGEIGGRIWELIHTPRSIEELVDILSNEYEVDPAVCEEQVEFFVQSLLNEQLIKVADELPK